MRLRITIDITRAAKVEPATYVEPEPAKEYAPQVTVKGAHILERSHQDEGNGMRGGDLDRWYRMGFRTNDERGKDE